MQAASSGNFLTNDFFFPFVPSVLGDSEWSVQFCY